MAHTPQAGKHDSAGRFQRYQCSTLFNYNTSRRIKFAREKGLDSWNFFSECWVLGTFSSNIKVNPVISWNGHNSVQRNITFKFSAFCYTSTLGASCFFSRKEHSNVCDKHWLTKGCSGGFINPFHSPRNEHSKMEFWKKNSEKRFEESRKNSGSKFYPATSVIAIFPCVALSYTNCSLSRIFADYCLTPKEIYNLNLSTITVSIWSFWNPTSIFCNKELYNHGLPPLRSLHSLVQYW